MSAIPEIQRQGSAAIQQRAVTVRALFEAGPLPITQKCIAAIRRDLPELLKTHRGWWVAYHGDEQIGVRRGKGDLYQECLRRGLSPEEFIVCGVEEGVFDPEEEVEATLDI